MPESMDEELRMLEFKIQQLKLDYEHYFSGARPREPAYPRSEIQKQFNRYSNSPIKNTAMRFKFNTLYSRFQCFKRQWDSILRQIEQGTYKRHLFRADLRDRERSQLSATPAARPTGGGDLFESYREAAASCGQNISALTREKLERVVRKQEAQLREKLGCEKVSFRVVVQDGKVKLKASPVR
ncbi:MAG: hypothetical protein O7G30_08665 [Proteobacteria bacterium]|nr:hypothetical protein [Pseudomonadota bacterium]